MKAVAFALFALVLSAGLGAAEVPPAATAPKSGPPVDVRGFIERKSQCDHWAGEEPYDRARAREIAVAMRALRCESLSSAERRLRSKYRHQPQALSALDAAEQ